MKEYREYEEIMEALLKATGNFEIFKTFEEKLGARNCTNEQLRQNILILTSLAEAVEDENLRLELYEKIIQELVLYIFKVDTHGTN